MYDPDRTSDRRPPEPNLQTSDRHQTSGPSRPSGRPVSPGRPTHLCHFRVEPQPMYPFAPSFALRIYIDLLFLLARVSKGLANNSCESFAHPLGYLLHRDSSRHRRRSPKRIQDLLLEKNIKTSSRRRTGYPFVSSLVVRGPCIVLCIRESSTCVTCSC